MNVLSKTSQVILLLLILTIGFMPKTGACQNQTSQANTAPTIDSNDKNAVVEFRTDIMPLFTRYGCNAAECHGAATGQGDFKLSLFGGDWAVDFDAVVNQLEGRRVNKIDSDKSLILTKPTEQLDHGGGERFEWDSKAAEKIRQWIASGASKRTTRIVSGIKVSHEKVVFDGDVPVAIQVRAITNFGEIDVTDQAKLTVANPSAVELGKNRLLFVKRPGKHFVIVKYLSFSKRIELVKPFPGALLNLVTDSNRRDSIIDRRLTKSARELGLELPSKVDDSVFVRRIYLDLIGRLPTRDEIRRLESSKRPELRTSELVNELLASDEFRLHWTHWLRQSLNFRVPGNDLKAAADFNQWLADQVDSELDWAKLATDTLTSFGVTNRNPAANYHRFFADARGEAESVASTFLGVKIGCANCHNHPLDHWTQEDYHGLAAVFATIKRGKTVLDFPTGNVIQPKTGRPAVPRIPGVNDLQGNSLENRKQLATWLTQSPQFRQAMVNRVWKKLMGRGIVEPVDDFRVSNPPIDSQLLDELSNRFHKNGQRLRPLIREIVLSRAYASKSIDPESPQQFLAGYYSKSISPDVLHDITKRLLLPQKKFELATESLRPEQFDRSLSLLKGCTEKNCDTGTILSRFGLREKLHLINGEFFNRWIRDQANWIHKSLQNDVPPADIIQEAYWRALGRSWAEQEKRYWNSQFADSELDDREQMQMLEDAIWSLLNSSEFRTIN